VTLSCNWSSSHPRACSWLPPGQKGYVIFGGRPERQRLYPHGFLTERDEHICVHRTKPPDVEFHTHLEVRFKLPNVEVSGRLKAVRSTVGLGGISRNLIVTVLQELQ
jgi:hypothetical protein